MRERDREREREREKRAGEIERKSYLPERCTKQRGQEQTRHAW